jgi:hypothetical protein
MQTFVDKLQTEGIFMRAPINQLGESHYLGLQSQWLPEGTK